MSENKSFDELLLPVRNDIDRIDKELLKLFTERMRCAERVAEIKRKAGIPVLNAAREQVIKKKPVSTATAPSRFTAPS